MFKTLTMNLHQLRTGELAAGVLVQQWNGPRRLDRRLSSLRPLGVTPPAPPGVDRAAWTLLWAAWVLCGRPSAENLLALAPPVPPSGGNGGAPPNAR